MLFILNSIKFCFFYYNLKSYSGNLSVALRVFARAANLARQCKQTSSVDGLRALSCSLLRLSAIVLFWLYARTSRREASRFFVLKPTFLINVSCFVNVKK